MLYQEDCLMYSQCVGYSNCCHILDGVTTYDADIVLTFFFYVGANQTMWSECTGPPTISWCLPGIDRLADLDEGQTKHVCWHLGWLSHTSQQTRQSPGTTLAVDNYWRNIFYPCHYLIRWSSEFETQFYFSGTSCFATRGIGKNENLWKFWHKIKGHYCSPRPSKHAAGNGHVKVRLGNVC